MLLRQYAQGIVHILFVGYLDIQGSWFQKKLMLHWSWNIYKPMMGSKLILEFMRKWWIRIHLESDLRIHKSLIQRQTSRHVYCMIHVCLLIVRLPALYSMDDEPSYELEICPTRKKKLAISAFFFPLTCRIEFTWPVLFSSKNCHFHWKFVNFPFLFFFPPTSAGQQFLFIFFFLQHAIKTPVRIRHP